MIFNIKNLYIYYMLQSSNPEEVYKNIFDLYERDLMPQDHIRFLNKMKIQYKFKPLVVYDLGSAVLHWTKNAMKLWPDSQYFCFDAFQPLQKLYIDKKINYNIGLLSDVDNKELYFYQNDLLFGGNSYYQESVYNSRFFPEQNKILKISRSLDSIVNERCWPLPDLIKIDVQGAELDILKGASKCLSKCKYLIVELQHMEYNKGAPLADVTIKYLDSIGFDLIAPQFCINPSKADADYCFINRNIVELDYSI